MQYSTSPATLLWPLLGVLCLGGCNDGINRPGSWSASGVNDANLVLMLDNPADLLAGRKAPNSRGAVAQAAVERLLQDKVHALQDARTSAISGGGGAGQ